jgi:hypothetical protein
MMRGSTVLFEAIDNPGLVEVVRGHLDFDAITYSEANETLSHFARDMGQNDVLVVEFNAEKGAGQHRVDASLEFEGFFSDCLLLHAGKN